MSTQTLDSMVEKRNESEDYLLDAKMLTEERPLTRNGRKRRRKAIISSLIRVLLEPNSPQESEEEAEKLESELDSEDRMYQLVRELIQFSKAGSLSPMPRAVNYPVINLEALKRHAQDKEKLLAFISELDQYVVDMDSVRHNKGVPRRAARAAEAGNSSGEQGNRDVWRELVTPDPISSHNLDTYSYNEGEVDQVSPDEYDSGDEPPQFDDAHLNLPYVDSVMPPCRGLSPVAEVSSELASAESTESIRNCQDLETELNAALSRLNSMTNELEEVEEAVLESQQTKVTETVTIGASLPTSKRESGGSESGNSRKQSTEKTDSSYEDAHDEFPSIPKSPPTLGIQAGHDRRDLASARKPRPPSLSRRNQQVLEEAVQMSSSEESGEESDGSQYSSDEDGVDDHVAGAEGEGVSHSLSDQFKLLSPSSLHHHTGAQTECQLTHQQHHHKQQCPSSTSVSNLYATVNKDAKRSSRAQSEGSECKDIPGNSVHRAQSSSLSELEKTENERSQEVEHVEKTPEKSLFIHDRVPPWKQMRSRNSSSNGSTGSPVTTPTQVPLHPHPTLHTSIGTTTDTSDNTPPPVPPRTSTFSSSATSQSQLPAQSLNLQAEGTTTESALLPPQQPQAAEAVSSDPNSDLYDKLPRVHPPPPIPSQAGLEGVYDTIIPYQQQQRRYLHEKVEKRSESPGTPSHPPVTWTPQLPPRNQMRRTTSADAMGEVLEDHDKLKLSRCDSERRRSTSSALDLHRERSGSSSSRRPRSSSGERDRDRRTKREHSSSSSEHHHHHHHRHHGEHSSSSSSRHRRSSEKHRSADKQSSSSSSKPKEGVSSFLKILVSPSSSKSKASSHSSKESSRKKEEERVKKEEGKIKKEEGKIKKEEGKIKKEDKKDKKHSSSSRSREKDASKEEPTTRIPRNESGTSLKSGVSMLSSGSSSGSSRDS